jgi:hypothetical protein
MVGKWKNDVIVPSLKRILNAMHKNAIGETGKLEKK